jgi:hypothetical protein
MNKETLHLPLESIHLNPNNPRTIGKTQMEKLKGSISSFPQMLELRPIMVDENNVILGGNMRYQALRQMGYESITVQRVSGLTEEQKKELVIKDNLSYGEWDWDKLTTEWEYEVLLDWGLTDFNIEDTLTNNQEYLGLDAASKLEKFMNAEIKRMFLVFDSETFNRVISWFEEKQEEYGVEDNSQVILKLMEK